MQNKINHNKNILKSLQHSNYQLIFSQHESCDKILNTVNSLSNDDDVKNDDINLFFDKCLLINSFKAMYFASKFKNGLVSTSFWIDAELLKFEQHIAMYTQYDKVTSHYLHTPIKISVDYLLLMHRLNANLSYCKKKSNAEVVYCKENFGMLNINILLDALSASKVPVILDCLYELQERSTVFLPDCDYINKSLVSNIIDVLVSSYTNNKAFISSKTLNSFEAFLRFISESSSDIFKGNELVLLQSLICSLLQDLMTVSKSFDKTTNDLALNQVACNELEYKVDGFEVKGKYIQDEIAPLQTSLSEKKQIELLCRNIKEIKERLSVAVSEKQNWKKKLLQVSRLCSVLKNIFSGGYNVQQLEPEFSALSDSFCLCENCLTSENVSHHDFFTPVNVIHIVREFYTSRSECKNEARRLNEAFVILRQEKTDFVNEITTLKQCAIDLEENLHKEEHAFRTMESKYLCLEDEYLSETMTLKESIIDLEEKLHKKEHALEDLQNKYTSLEDNYQSFGARFVESDNVSKGQEEKIQTHLDLNKCKNDYETLLDEYIKVKDDILMKEQKIEHCEKVISEKNSEYEAVSAKCRCYKVNIDELNNTIGYLSANLSQSESKVVSLEKSSNLLNKTIEGVEEELQNIYSEKQKIDESLHEKTVEVETLQQELQESKNKFSEVQNSNCKLQNDIIQLASHINELNATLLEKDSFITLLREKVNASNKFNHDLEMKIESLNDELEKKIGLLGDCKDKLVAAIAERGNFEEQINELLELKNEKMKLLESEREVACRSDKLIAENEYLTTEMDNLLSENKFLKCELGNLVSETKSLKLEVENELSRNKSLKSELENLYLDKSELEDNVKALNDKIRANDKEMKHVINSQGKCHGEIDQLIVKNKALKSELDILLLEKSKLQDDVKSLNNEVSTIEGELKKAVSSRETKLAEIEKLKKKIGDLSKEIKFKDKSNLESSHLVEELLKKVDKLKKEVSDSTQTSEIKISQLELEKTSLLSEIRYLKMQENNPGSSCVNSKCKCNGFLTKLVVLLTDVVKSMGCRFANQNIAELVSKLSKWEAGIENSDSYMTDIQEKLDSFLKSVTDKQKELESKIYNLTKSTFKFLNTSNQYCDLVDPKSPVDVTAFGDVSCLNDTLCADVVASCSLTNLNLDNLVSELERSITMMDSEFNVLKDSVIKKDMEIKSLQGNLTKEKLQDNTEKLVNIFSLPIYIYTHTQ